MSHVVGLGVCAAPIEQPNLRKPPMVVLIEDLRSVDGDAGHARTAIIDDEISSMVAAMDWEPAQELAEWLPRAADRIEKYERTGQAPAFADRAWPAMVPEAMTAIEVVATLRFQNEGRHVTLCAVLAIGDREFCLDANGSRKLSEQLARHSRRVRETQRAA